MSEKTKRRRTEAPTMNARAVARRLQFSGVESVHILVRETDPNKRLQGYILDPETGEGWIAKQGSGHSGVEVMFYADDVERWAQAHPIVHRKREAVHYSPEEARIVLEVAEQIKKPLPDGSGFYVNRTGLNRILAWKEGTYNKQTKRGEPRNEPGYGPNVWNARAYKKIRQILNDYDYKLPPQMPRDTSVRRKYERGGKRLSKAS